MIDTQSTNLLKQIHVSARNEISSYLKKLNDQKTYEDMQLNTLIACYESLQTQDKPIFSEFLQMILFSALDNPDKIDDARTLLECNIFSLHHPIIEKFDLQQLANVLNEQMAEFFLQQRKIIKEFLFQRTENNTIKKEDIANEQNKIILERKNKERRSKQITKINPECVFCGHQTDTPSLKCKICQKTWHVQCINQSPQKQDFICPECVLLNLDPLYPVKEAVVKPFPFKPSQNSKFQPRFLVPYKPEFLNHYLQIRCIRLDSTIASEEQTWPDTGTIKINDNQVLKFEPLKIESSLKKRKDNPYTWELVFNDQQSLKFQLEIAESYLSNDTDKKYRIHRGKRYFIGVFLVAKLTWIALTNSIIEDQTKWIDIKDCQSMIRKQFRNNAHEDILVNKQSIKLQCPYDCDLIQTPARGTFCRHIQCFSLENFLKGNEKIVVRKYNCPICNKKCFDFVIDSYQYAILSNERKNPEKIRTEIFFNEKGQIDDPEMNKKVEEVYLENLKENKIILISSDDEVEPETQKKIKLNNMNSSNFLVIDE